MRKERRKRARDWEEKRDRWGREREQGGEGRKTWMIPWFNRNRETLRKIFPKG